MGISLFSEDCQRILSVYLSPTNLFKYTLFKPEVGYMALQNNFV